MSFIRKYTKYEHKMVILVYIISAIFSWLKIVASSPSILIIGAGPAGIAAGTKLLENNLTNFKILEAEPRIGGRINSVKFGDAFVDLGAQWCHGEKGNIVYDMVKNLNLLETTAEPEIFYLSSKQTMGDFAKEIVEIVKYTIDDYPSDVDLDSSYYHESVGEYCRESYNKIIHEKYRNDSRKLQIAVNAIDLLESLVLSNEGAFSWFDPSLISDFKSSDGDYHLNWKGKGYKMILDVMMKKFPDPKRELPIDDKIIFHKEVTRITWNAQTDWNNIWITCSDNSIYVADHVIFTPSIGVLKERASELFYPRLPTEKLRAINDIGFGAVVKVAMFFSVNWWRDAPGFLLLWTEEDKKTVANEFPEGPTWDGKSWLIFMNFITKTDHNPNVMIAWFTGPIVPAVELLPEELLIRGVHFVMKKFLSHLYDVRKPEKILRSNWYSNPHFRGTYSFQTIHARRENGRPSAEEDLAEPLKDIRGRPIVQFAGEATHPHYYSTVHGAIETGYREAEVILDLYK